MKASVKAITALVALMILGAAGIYAYNATYAPSCGQYKDGFLCTPHGTDPVSYTRDLIRTSSHVTIVFEAEPGKTQRNVAIDASATQLAIYFGSKNPEVYGIVVEGGKPTACYNSQNRSLSVDFCQNLKPQSGDLILLLKYPEYGRNEIIASPSLIEFHARDPLNELALVRAMFGKLFFP